MSEKDTAVELFKDGYNCSQSVFTAFAYRFGIDEETALKISAGLGGGIGRMREVCGAVSGAAMVIGSICAATEGKDSETKQKNYELVREFAERFAKINGSVICRELLGLDVKMESSAQPESRTAEYYKKRPCVELVECAAEILEELIAENK
jgi:C_GCAxxG_C_C family probable redox protein